MNIFTTIGKALKDNAPSILTGMAMASAVETVILALDAGEKIAYEKSKGDYADKPRMQKIQPYIPTVTMGTITLAFIFAANQAHLNKEAGLAAFGTLFETKYNDYRAKNRELYSEENDEKIIQSINRDKMTQNPPPGYLRQYAEEDGSFLCYEPYTDQYFTATKAQLMWAELTANKMFQHEEAVTLNHILKLLPGVSATRPEGEHIGWYLDDDYYEYIGYNWGYYGRPWVDFKPNIEEIDGQEVMVMNFSIGPVNEGAWDLDDMKDPNIGRA